MLPEMRHKEPTKLGFEPAGAVPILLLGRDHSEVLTEDIQGCPLFGSVNTGYCLRPA